MTSCAVVLVVLATTTAAASSFAPPAVEATPRVHIDAVVVDARIPAHVEVEDALRVRLTDRPVSDSTRARAPNKGELFAYIEIESATAERASVRLLLSDGRAYVRTIDAPQTTRAREIAATIANLLAGIEEGAIAPTQEHVPLPRALRPVAPPAKPKPRPVAPAIAPRPEWGLAVGGAAIFGVGPPAPQGFAAGGGELRGEARWPRGPTLGLALRLAGTRTQGYGLVRIRIAPSFGWAWRRGNFELHTIAMITVEPWALLHDAPVVDRRPVSAVLGGALRLEPVGRVPLARGKSLRIGPFVEVAGSAIPSRSGGVARLRRRDDTGELEDLFRVGGLEIAAGLVIGPWIPVR